MIKIQEMSICVIFLFNFKYLEENPLRAITINAKFADMNGLIVIKNNKEKISKNMPSNIVK